MEKTTVGIKTVKRRKTSIFMINKRLREAKVKFLIEHDKRNSNTVLLNYTLKKLPIRTFLIHPMN